MAKVSIKNVTVEYPLMTPRKQSLRVNLVHLGSAGLLAKDLKGNMIVKALNNVSFDVSDGDRVGLIGRNGAGKTTLLKLINGIYLPSTGSSNVSGTISSLLGLGLTVDPELSGIEAIKWSCIIKGLPKDRIHEIQDDVTEFTELGDFLNMPIRTYSAGMLMRLAFAIATSNNPDILLMDEGIGAGDQFFLEKVKTRTQNFIDSANIVFMASHSPMLLKDVCDKAFLMDHGTIIAAGPIDDMFAIYNDLNKEKSTFPIVDISDRPEPYPKVLCHGTFKNKQVGNNDEGSDPSCAFDDSPKTYWRGTTIMSPRSTSAKKGLRKQTSRSHNHDTDSGTLLDAPWIGLEFNTPKHPRTAFIRQRTENFAAENICPQISVEVSEDRFKKDIRVAAVADMPPTSANVVVSLGDIGMGRWWRIRATLPTKSGLWDLTGLNFSSVVSQEQHSGKAICSGRAADEVGPENAFSLTITTQWVSMESGIQVQGLAWIGWDFGTNKLENITTLIVRQWDRGQKPNTVKSVLLQASNDCFSSNVQSIQELKLEPHEDFQSFQVKDAPAARFWRIIASSGTKGGRWGISFINFESKTK